MRACPSAYPAYGLGNRCSDNDENRQFGVTFHRGVQREIGFDLRGQGKGQGPAKRQRCRKVAGTFLGGLKVAHLGHLPATLLRRGTVT